jgi:hypothetical protein
MTLESEFGTRRAEALAITSWYDHKRLFRLSPDLVSYVSRVADQRLSSAHPKAAAS